MSLCISANIPRLRFNVLSIDYVRVINCFYDYDYDYMRGQCYLFVRPSVRPSIRHMYMSYASIE